MASVRSSYVQAYVDHQLAEQYVEHIDAQDDPALTEQVKEARSGLAAQLEQVPSALRPIFEDLASMSSYIEIVQSIGGEDYEEWAAGVDVQARKSVVEGKRVAVRVDIGGRRSIKKNKSRMRQDQHKHTTPK